jgi:hypothetical protein
MKRSRMSSIAAAAVSLVMVPILWIFALDAIPALDVVRHDASGGRMGPWVFTWALVWIASIAAVVVAWLCYTATEDAAS